MSNYSINYNNSGLFDFTFLNPFALTSENIYFGSRYGFAQFVLLFFLLCVIIVGIYKILNKNIVTSITLIIIFIWGIFNYYAGSCILIPDKHSRCYIFAWINIIFLLIIGVSFLLSETKTNTFTKTMSDSYLFDFDNTQTNTKQINPEMSNELNNEVTKSIENIEKNVNIYMKSVPRVHSKLTNYELYKLNIHDKQIFFRITKGTFWADEAYKLKGKQEDYDKVMKEPLKKREAAYYSIKKLYEIIDDNKTTSKTTKIL